MLRARERDLAYIAARKMAAFGQSLARPEHEKVALRFILDMRRTSPTGHYRFDL